jgi:hypothetical protein
MPTAHPTQAEHVERAEPARGTPNTGGRSCWLLGISGLALLVVSVVMMAVGA